MDITKELLKQLRDETGAGIVDIKKALEAARGDAAQAVDLLRKQGKKVAAKKADRVTREGAIGSYVHANGKVAALVAVTCETDFVARTEAFQSLAHDLALHVAAANPAYLKPEDVPPDVLAREEEIARSQAMQEKKPAAILEKIVQGKIDKFYAEQCLLRQSFVKDDALTITELVANAIAKLGENIEIREFSRVQLS